MERALPIEEMTQGGGDLVSLENLRILHVSTWKIPCGIATYCENLTRALEAHGAINTIAPLVPSDWKYSVKDDVQQWRESILDKARGVDLVHIQHEHGFFGYGVGSRFACKRFGELLDGLAEAQKPVVTTFHTDICTQQRRGLRGKWDRFRRKRLWKSRVTHHFGAMPGTAKAIVHSNATRFSFVRHGFPVPSVHVVPHPCLDPKTYRSTPEMAKHLLGLPSDSVLMSIFGFIGRYKGHDHAIEALKQLPENYHLAIVGGAHPESRDSFLDSLLKSIPDELKHRVHITGWVDRETADTYFAATDVCLAPYRGDTSLSGSGAITWGLSSGRPVIASKIEAFQSVDRIGNCLFLVSPDKTSELAWAVQKLIADPSLRSKLVNNANTFSSQHSWSNSVDRIASIYQLAMGHATHTTGLSVYPSSEAA